MKFLRMCRKTRITINYTICGDGNKIDPRNCHLCMGVCDPAIFLLHQTEGINEANPLDPQFWRITPLYTSLCTKCLNCVHICPENAITIR